MAFAVVDTNGRGAGGLHEHRTFQAASLAKAILLVASLRKDPTPDAGTEATLTKMIVESDNGAAYTIFGRVGGQGMRAVAKAAGMQDYEQGSDWIDTRVSAADQARFFYDLDSLLPAAGRSLARRLLSGVTPMQRWGIPAAAGPEGWSTYFKGGWLGLDNKLMVQAAWLEKGEKKWALAVMSDENPDRSYGWDTQKGVTGLLLGRSRRRRTSQWCSNRARPPRRPRLHSGYSIASTVSSRSPAGRRQSTVLPTRASIRASARGDT